MGNQIKKIAILGRDLDAWITAFFLKSVLDKPGTLYDIMLIDIGTEISGHDVYAVLPSYRMLHTTLGANEEKLRKTARANIYFGQRFTGWNPELPDFFHAYDRHGIDFNGIDFFQYWMKAERNGMKLPLENFSLGVAAAKHRRLIADAGEGGFSHVAYGYHLSAHEYVDAIARAAIGVGVKRTVGQVKNVNSSNEKIASVVLQDGTVIEADFFIDASGPESLLINSLSSDNFESWDQWFRCDRMIAASCRPVSPVPVFSQITAFSSGWCGLYPLSNRTAVKALYSSHDTDFLKVVDEIKTCMGVDIGGGIERKINCGMLKRPWIGNCLAIGSAAAVLEPLDALQQHSLVISMVMLRQLFPNSDEYGNERNIYNDKMHSFIENIRNFQIAHYKLNSRPEPFWVACRDAESPAVLAQKIALFKRSGYVSIREDETFQEENWISIFNGHGLSPDFYSPLVDNMAEEELIKNLQKILGAIGKRIESSPLID